MEVAHGGLSTSTSRAPPRAWSDMVVKTQGDRCQIHCASAPTGCARRRLNSGAARRDYPMPRPPAAQQVENRLAREFAGLRQRSPRWGRRIKPGSTVTPRRHWRLPQTTRARTPASPTLSRERCDHQARKPQPATSSRGCAQRSRTDRAAHKGRYRPVDRCDRRPVHSRRRISTMRARRRRHRRCSLSIAVSAGRNRMGR